jgi:anti-sigma-K factor RskA
MRHDKLFELCPVYALGALDGEELREFEAHLAGGCAVCEAEVREYAGLTGSIPEALPAVVPSGDLKDRLLEKLDALTPRQRPVTERPSELSKFPQKVSRRQIWLPWACAAAAGVALAISLFNVTRLDREIASQQARVKQLTGQMADLQNQLEQERAVTSFLSKPEVRVTMLAGIGKTPQAAGKILWSAQERKALFYASNLPVAPSGKTYQLWIIADNKPFDAGIFAVDPQGNGFLRVESLSEAVKAQKFAVTLEPAGGVPQPTGEMHLLGSV